ncbi:MAG: RuvX/YqgF family protein [bacterium]|nr:RuvX/YqgF family protein [bacterium]
MKYLGIDYGSKRIGIAITDEKNQMAFPKSVIKNSGNSKGNLKGNPNSLASVIKEIKDLCLLEKIQAIVIGESKNYKNEPNKIMKDISHFVKELEKATFLPVHLHPEFLTSSQAERLQGKNDMLDASSATIILQSYIDSHKLI